MSGSSGGMASEGLGRSKLLYHAEKFAICTSPQKVLRRYTAKAKHMAKKELVRHISHVCAWIALAHPIERAACRYGGTLSPVLVLSRMLALKCGARLDARGLLSLRAVRATCMRVLEHPQETVEYRQDWIDLLERIPAQSSRTKHKMSARAVEASSLDDALVWKRVRRLHVHIRKWVHQDLARQESIISDIEVQLAKLLENDLDCIDTIALRRMMYEVVGALSCPRKKPGLTDVVAHMTEDDVERFRRSAKLQKRVRQILLTCVVTWRERLQLEDAQIEPVLSHLKYYIDSFEHGHLDVEYACAGKQWSKLKAAVGLLEDVVSPSTTTVAPGPGHAASQRVEPKQETLTESKRSQASYRDGIYQPPAKVLALPTIEHDPDNPKVLKCTLCAFTMTSSWYFVQPKTKVRAVLIPHNGHSSCRQGKRPVPFVVADGSKGLNDYGDTFDFCMHGIRRRDCRPCGGRGICSHSVLSRNCKLCGRRSKKSRDQVVDKR
eukprot:TRINITY_DN20198_c0_g3_i1.p1 TRINITY_DN20198_c0_g3~~TRINITY_DN20198_c0_g3_i1.p1  ORF type:complete len:493 (-),score=45.56 TRINITY_DN20198_c0_g3_i1:296-1774(-)